MRTTFFSFIWVLWAVPALAQASPCGTPPKGVTKNPMTMCWTPVDPLCDTIPPEADSVCISGYEAEYWPSTVDPAVGTPRAVMGIPREKILGPATNGEVWVRLDDLTPPPSIVYGEVYVVRVRALSELGSVYSERSNPSNTFKFQRTGGRTIVASEPSKLSAPKGVKATVVSGNQEK